MILGTRRKLTTDELLNAFKGIDPGAMKVISGSGFPLGVVSKRPGVLRVRSRTPVAEPQ